MRSVAEGIGSRDDFQFPFLSGTDTQTHIRTHTQYTHTHTDTQARTQVSRSASLTLFSLWFVYGSYIGRLFSRSRKGSIHDEMGITTIPLRSGARCSANGVRELPACHPPMTGCPLAHLDTYSCTYLLK